MADKVAKKENKTQGEVKEETNFQTQTMFDSEGSYRISKVGDKYQFTVLSTTNYTNGNFPGRVINLEIIKQFPTGYTIAKGPNGELFDFNETSLHNVMGKLINAYKVHESGSYVTERDQGYVGKTYAYVSGQTKEDQKGYGERTKINKDQYQSIIDASSKYYHANNRAEDKKNKNVVDFADKINLNIANAEYEFDKIIKDQSLHKKSYIGEHEIEDREVFYPKGPRSKPEDLTDEYGNDKISIFKRDSGKMLMRVDSKKGTVGLLEINSYQHLAWGERCEYLVCDYKNKKGEQKNIMVNSSGAIVSLSHEQQDELGEIESQYQNELDENARLRDEKIVNTLSGKIQEKV